MRLDEFDLESSFVIEEALLAARLIIRSPQSVPEDIKALGVLQGLIETEKDTEEIVELLEGYIANLGSTEDLLTALNKRIDEGSITHIQTIRNY